ncbi:MAG: RNA-binding domain-containing protein [Candidatus Bathyarchaeia archaeon]
MPEERLVKAAEISVFAHATEDEEKVKQAVKRIARYEHVFESQRLSGHYDDPITLLTSKTTKKTEATDLLANIVNKLSSIDRQTLLDELPNRIDPKGNLYLRLDKQKAFNGKIALQENDPIRIKLKFQLPHKADPAVTIREYIINAEEDDPE